MKKIGRPKIISNDIIVASTVYTGSKQKEYLKDNDIDLSPFLRWCIDEQHKGRLKYVRK